MPLAQDYCAFPKGSFPSYAWPYRAWPGWYYIAPQPRYKQPSGGGTTGKRAGLAPYIYVGKSFEGIYRIHADDKEVLEIIIKAMTSGIIN